MSQLEGSHRLALPTLGWLPRLPLSQWILALLLAAVIAALPGLWTLPGLVVLAAALVVLMKPEAAVYLLTLSVPLGYLLELEGEEFSATPTEAIVGMMVIGWALRALGRRSLVIPLTPLLVPLVGMLTVVAFSGGHAVSAGLTLKETLKWAELLLVYLFVVAEMGNLRHALGLLSMLFLGASIEALVGAAQFFFNLGPDFYSVGRFMRAYGTFEQPNPYAGYLGMIIPLAFGLVLAQPEVRRRNWTLIALALAVTAVAMSLSRGAWVGISLAIAVMMLFWSHHTRILLAAGTLAATPLGALAYMNLLPAELANRMATMLDYFRFVDVTREVVTPENFALIERMAHWQAALDMIAAGPLLGMGAGNYPAVYELFAVRGWNEALGHAHNFYLNVAAETGIVGVAVYLSIFIVALLHAIKGLLPGARAEGDKPLQYGAVRRDGQATNPHSQVIWRGILLGVLGSLVAVCVHNMFDSLFVHGMSIQLGMIMALGQLSAAALSQPLVRSRTSL